MKVDQSFRNYPLILTAWIAANVYAYVHGHTRTRPTSTINKISRRDSWSTRTVVGPRPTENQLLQCFEFHDKHGRNRRKERICFDHELVRDQNKAVLLRHPVIEIQSVGNYFA